MNRILGGCTEIRQVCDIVDAAKKIPNVLFHSTNPYYPLIDFIYQDEEGNYNAFQATLGETHKANSRRIRALEKKVGGPKKLNLYYLVPTEKFHSFRTEPPNPRENEEVGVSCNIWHTLIPKP